MMQFESTKKYRRDIKRVIKQGFDLTLLDERMPYKTRLVVDLFHRRWQVNTHRNPNRFAFRIISIAYTI